MSDVLEMAKNAREAAINALQLSDDLKKNALSNIAISLEENKTKIIEANKIDLDLAKKLLFDEKITQSAFNRLKLDENKMRDMIQGIRDIINLDSPVNKVLWSKQIAVGITLKKITCPIGVIGVIFEARPDVISQITALSIKSSNAVILKGGSEAKNTNNQIFNIIVSALKNIKDFPSNMVNIINSRDDVNEMLKADEFINLIIPRGSNSLVKYIKSNTKIPVLGHSDGICHIYIDEYADIEKTIKVCMDSKCQYPAACNSVETILIHEKILPNIINRLFSEFTKNQVKIIADDNIIKYIPSAIKASEDDWKTEYSDKIISLKTVKTINDAITHINKYGSGHTDCIMTENNENVEKFMMFVDSAGVYNNISTRFADGYRYGFGAEVGISTNKTHARGPVGLEGLTIYKYRLYGQGDIVDDFINGSREFIK